MYGLNGAPAIWQRYVDGLFQGMDGVKVFMDDARITGSDEISHFTALEEFFKKCREHGLKLNLNKTTIANPLNNLIKKNVRFLWSKDCQVAFEQIKKEICSPKILVHYDPSLPLTLASDASPVGIGCVLSHVYPDGSERPIAGLPVLAATRLLHYALILQSFEFDIIFRKTIEHGNADFLSRLPKTPEELEVKDDITIFQMSQIEALPVTSKELRQETSKDIELGPLLRALREDNDIEEAAKNCVDCARYKADPPKSKVHYWEYPSMPWERIHVDFAGPIFEHTFFSDR
ncbi:uncharacterized protein K02A2.6 [Trichonephila clavipes]|nr:uncharacterized protein K02A2.6 [Trichonephila clavipes]